MRQWRLLCILGVTIAALWPGIGSSVPNKPVDGYDLYVTVVQGFDGKEVAGVDVEVTGPAGQGPITALVPRVAKTDYEGIVKFHLALAGKYTVSVKNFRFKPATKTVEVSGPSATYTEIRLDPAAARIIVKAKDSLTGDPIPGVSIATLRADSNVADHLDTDASGTAYVVMPQDTSSQGSSVYTVTASHRDYVSQSQQVAANRNESRDYPVTFNLARKADRKLFSLTLLDSETREPIVGAHVSTNGAKKMAYAQVSDDAGKASLMLPTGFSYSIEVHDSRYEDQTVTLDLTDATAADTTNRELLLVAKEQQSDVRRAAIIYVRWTDENGNLQPLKGANIEGPGEHDAETDVQGRIVLLHRIAAGETLSFSVSHPKMKPASGSVLVKARGGAIDMRQLARDRRGDTSTYDALMKQSLGTYDEASVTMELKGDSTYTVEGDISTPKNLRPGDDASLSINLLYKDGGGDVLDVLEFVEVRGPDGLILRGTKRFPRSLPKGVRQERPYDFVCRQPGTYKVKVRVDVGTDAVWSAQASFDVKKEHKDVLLSGTVVPKKSLAKLDERVDVGINVLYEDGPDLDMTVKETVELYNPKGQMVQNNFAERNLRRGSYSERNMAIVCQESGTFKLKSTITDTEGKQLWTGETTFEISKATKSNKPVMEKPGEGFYKLKKTTVGEAPGPAVGPYGTWSGSIGESSFQASYEGKPPYDSHANLSLQWSVPPSVIKSGDTIDLTVTGSGSVTGKDYSYVGVSGSWAVEGPGITVLEAKSAFVGYGSDGKLYASSTGKYKVKIGQGGKLRIYNGHAGCSWGSSNNWTPGLYEYEWVANASPPDDEEKPSKPTSMDGGTPTVPVANKEEIAGRYRDDKFTMADDTGDVTFALTITLRPTSRPGVFSVDGVAQPVKDGARKIEITGTFYQATRRLAAKGELMPRSGDDYSVTINGSMDSEGSIVGIIVVSRDKDGKTNQGAYKATKS